MSNQGQSILVTGGSDGLGKSIAKRLTTNNKVTILSPTKEKIIKAADELGCDYLVCDVSAQKEVESSFKKFLEKNGRIDCLINNAGLWVGGKLEDNDPEEIERLLQVNTLGTILFSRIAIPQMKKQKEGIIININSQAGLNSKAERTIYNTSKWAITGFTKALQLELAESGIRVTGLYPGRLSSSMNIKTSGKRNVPDSLPLDEVAKTVEFILSVEKSTLFPEIGIKRVNS